MAEVAIVKVQGSRSFLIWKGVAYTRRVARSRSSAFLPELLLALARRKLATRDDAQDIVHVLYLTQQSIHLYR